MNKTDKEILKMNHNETWELAESIKPDINNLLFGIVPSKMTIAAFDELSAAVFDLVATTCENVMFGSIQPGDKICDTACPCCGARLKITHGGDPGEIAVVGGAKP